MASYVWPTSLPQPLASFTEMSGVQVLSSPMDAGPAKMRRRAARGSVFNLQFVMRKTQVQTLDDFCKTSLQGVNRFDFLHPRTRATIEVRIVPDQSGTLFTASYVAPDLYHVDMVMEECL